MEIVEKILCTDFSSKLDFIREVTKYPGIFSETNDLGKIHSLFFKQVTVPEDRVTNVTSIFRVRHLESGSFVCLTCVQDKLSG